MEKALTISQAKNVRPGLPEIIVIKGLGERVTACPAYDMLYDPINPQKTPDCETTETVQG